MKDTGTISPWMSDMPAATRPLDGDAAADVAVVGAGIAGLSVAYELVLQGRSVIVIDDGPIGGGETGRTTAHLATALDRRYFNLEELVGELGASVCAASHAAAIARIERVCAAEQIACDFLRVDGYLFAPPEDRERALELIERERAAAARAGVRVDVVARAPLTAFDTGPSLLFHDQGQLQPGKYIRGLAEAIVRRGGRVCTQTRAAEFRGGDAPSIRTERGDVISAGALVVATNTPVNDRVTMHTKQVAYRSYVIGLRVERGAMEAALLWDGFWDDQSRPYHYVRLRKDDSQEHELLIVGGEDHPTGREDDAEARYRALEAWARERFPFAREVEYQWSGQIMEPHDEVAYIGLNPGDKHVHIVTGDSGNGMTHGVVAGLMLPALIDGQDHPWKDVYSPARLPTHAVGHAVAENAATIAQYRDWVMPHHHVSVENLLRGQGVVVRDGIGRPRAVYRDESGVLHWRSAVCPHLQGVVRWNPGEKSWDCPCHGSRFDCKGRAINGPALGDLAEAHDHREAHPEPAIADGEISPPGPNIARAV